ncbi:MAG: 4'-phosphopantetheinyl transferase superfamily protein [Flavobacteriales bacterium]|nr:4'-phosphopantetheinyl transferase superfamily protein [Flavobacteriales bacterium]
MIRKRPREGSLLGVWKIDEDDDWYFTNPLLTERVQNRINGYKSVQHQLQGIAVRILIKNLLPEEANVDIDYDEKSKPFFISAPYKLSISHSEDMVAVLISDLGEVGVDIERRSSKLERVASKFMNSAELGIHEQLPDLDSPYYLHILWGAKESMFKLYGKGSLDFKKHMLVENFELLEEGSFSGSIEKDDKLIRVDGFYGNVGKFVLVYVLESQLSDK